MIQFERDISEAGPRNHNGTMKTGQDMRLKLFALFGLLLIFAHSAMGQQSDASKALMTRTEYKTFLNVLQHDLSRWIHVTQDLDISTLHFLPTGGKRVAFFVQQQAACKRDGDEVRSAISDELERSTLSGQVTLFSNLRDFDSCVVDLNSIDVGSFLDDEHFSQDSLAYIAWFKTAEADDAEISDSYNKLSLQLYAWAVRIDSRFDVQSVWPKK
jgi:hypothetical protein